MARSSKKARRTARLSADDITGQAVRVALDVRANVVESTPIDTGLAKASWGIGVGAPYEGVGSGPSTVSALAGYRSENGPIHITNNLRYIQRLNDGSSQQAPAGFVQIAIDRAVTENGG